MKRCVVISLLAAGAVLLSSSVQARPAVRTRPTGLLARVETDLHSDLLRIVPQPAEKVFRPIRIPGKVVAITVDDGPDPRFTPTLLELFKRENIKATFFLVGKNVQEYPYLARQEAEDGHVLANHTYDHVVLGKDTEAQDVSEMERCRQAIWKATGRETHLFRPPCGVWNNEVFQAASSLDYRMVLWSVTVEHKAAKTPEMMAKRVLKLVRPGDIILCHDGRLNRTKTMEALPAIVKGLKAQGYRFVTVPELMRLEPAAAPE